MLDGTHPWKWRFTNPANGEFTYSLRGVHAKVSVKWAFEAPAGAGDTHDSLLRGQGKKVPEWEVPNTLVKYRMLMDAWRLSR